MLDQIVEIGCYMNLLIDAMPTNALGGVNNFIDYFKPIFRVTNLFHYYYSDTIVLLNLRNF